MEGTEVGNFERNRERIYIGQKLQREGNDFMDKNWE